MNECVICVAGNWLLTIADDEEEKTVSVLLDGEESIMDIVDVPDGQVGSSAVF